MTSTITTPSDFEPPAPSGFAGYGDTLDLGQNWRVAFRDADGVPLNMNSFEVIDFGAISYKEIFQNVKTICATPLFSAALERLLGVDGRIVDLPINTADDATVEFLRAIYFWENRARVIDIVFEADVLNGHLIATLKLDIKNVIYGTDTDYTQANIFNVPTRVQQGLPPIVPVEGIPGPPGAKGDQGTRGSLWFTGSTAPPSGALIPMKHSAQGPPGPKGPQGDRGFVWLQGAGDPVTPQANDMYLNTSNGDVWQFDGVTWRKQ